MQIRAARVCSPVLEKNPPVRRVGLVSKELNRKEPAQTPVPGKPAISKPMYGTTVGRGGMVSKISVTLPGDKSQAKKELAPVVLNLRQVATRLKIPVNEVKDMLRAGTLRGNLSGVPQPELEAYIRVHRPHLLKVVAEEIDTNFEEKHLPTFRALRRGLVYRLDVWTRAVIGLFVLRKRPTLVITLPPPPPPPEPAGPPDSKAVLEALLASDVRRLKLLMEEHLELVLEALDQERNGCLHLAVMAGGYERTFLLVNAGAELNARNANGLTPLGLVTQSKKGGWKQVATLLEERGAVL